MQDTETGSLEPSPGRAAEPKLVLSGDQAVRILATQGRLLELIATGEPFAGVLEALVTAVEAQCEGSIGSVLLLDEDGKHLRHGSAPGLPREYNEAVDGLRIGASVGSCGTAAYRGERVVVEDVETDPLWVDYRELARRHGLRACWSQPILSADRKVLGTFATYYRKPRTPTAADLAYIEGVAHLAGIAIERYRAQRMKRAAERRLLKQKSVLVELAQSEQLESGDFRAFIKLATEAAADTLGLERVGVWLFSDDRSVLRCDDLYESSFDRHTAGLRLEADRYPRYFAALERGRSVVANDAHEDPDTSEFSATYLTPLGITSMLDAPVRKAGRLVGVVCHEHVGPARVWAVDEQDFAASVGDFVSLALEGSERRKAQQAFRSAQEELLRRQFQARRQVEFELDRMKDELVRQTRLATIGQVAASIAHELRNPLGSIRNAAFLLHRRVGKDDEKTAHYLDIIDQEIHRADITINDLLEMSQAKRPVREAVDLAEAARDSFAYLRSSDGIELRLAFEEDPFEVEADADQLRQVLTNLMSNAAEAMKGMGKIVVEAGREGGFDAITVEDTGPGVPAELRPRVFEPLVTTKAKGTGLGLAICRQIVEAHGGTVVLEDGERGGARFRIRLPRRGGQTE